MTFEDFGAGVLATLHGREAVTLERQPDFLWGGRPVYRCRVCGDRFERVEDLGAVLKHEAEAHAAPPPIVRESRILGADGEPFLVEEVPDTEERES